MTALSSVLGFMPLMVASGAGAASRQAIGTELSIIHKGFLMYYARL
jgi:multidrug efflux pump subunit AcrB